MTLRLHDTETRDVREFTPLVPGQVSIYLCGATVQAPPHIGHLRAALLRHRPPLARSRGYAVTFVRNVTDIDDKIIRKAAEQGVETWRVAQANEYAFQQAYRLLGCEDPSVEPRATGHIPEMVAMMHRLIDDGHAYAAGGDVYFRVRSLPEYGALAHFSVDDLEEQPVDDVAPTHAQGGPARLRAVEGLEAGRAVLGHARGAPAAPAGTWSARRWRTATWARTSTSTAAAST